VRYRTFLTQQNPSSHSHSCICIWEEMEEVVQVSKRTKKNKKGKMKKKNEELEEKSKVKK
jgi:hypothetical protein